MTERDPEADIRALMTRYIDLFNKADFETALAEGYNLPFSWQVGPAIDTVASPDEFVARMSGMRSALADQGFERSELLGCTVRMMGSHAALAGVKVARHYTDRREPEISGGTYIVHGDGNHWRLTSFLAHPIEDIVD